MPHCDTAFKFRATKVANFQFHKGFISIFYFKISQQAFPWQHSKVQCCFHQSNGIDAGTFPLWHGMSGYLIVFGFHYPSIKTFCHLSCLVVDNHMYQKCDFFIVHVKVVAVPFVAHLQQCIVEILLKFCGDPWHREDK